MPDSGPTNAVSSRVFSIFERRPAGVRRQPILEESTPLNTKQTTQTKITNANEALINTTTNVAETKQSTDIVIVLDERSKTPSPPTHPFVKPDKKKPTELIDLTLSPPPKPAFQAFPLFNEARKPARKETPKPVLPAWPSRLDAHVGLDEERWNWSLPASWQTWRKRQRNEVDDTLITTSGCHLCSVEEQALRVDAHLLKVVDPESLSNLFEKQTNTATSSHELVLRIQRLCQEKWNADPSANASNNDYAQLYTVSYAPKTAGEVLGNQGQSCAKTLMAWLQQVQVRASAAETVECCPSVSAPSLKRKRGVHADLEGARRAQLLRPVITRRVAKRTRKGRASDSDDDMDDFIVDDDFEDDDYKDLALREFDCFAPDDNEVFKSPPPEPLQQEAFQDTTDKPPDAGFSDLFSVMVLAGPSGVGKTSSVYAVAAELGWEVFEVNSGQLRNRKELERLVSDVGQNHTLAGPSSLPMVGGVKSPVKKTTTHSFMSLLGCPTAPRKPEAQLDEIEFLGATNDHLTPRTEYLTDVIDVDDRRDRMCTPPPNVAQQVDTSRSKKSKIRQSLILIEEVDVIYAHEKDFWPAVVDLVASSMRPIILTCNDPKLIPMHTLPVQDVLHYQAPEVDVTVEFLHSIAALEGHLLSRDSLVSLYKASAKVDSTSAPPFSDGPQQSHPKPSQELPTYDLRRTLLQLQLHLRVVSHERVRDVVQLTSSVNGAGHAFFDDALPIYSNLKGEDTDLIDVARQELQLLPKICDVGPHDNEQLVAMARTTEALSYADAFIDRSSQSHIECWESGWLQSDSDDPESSEYVILQDKRGYVWNPAIPAVHSRDTTIAASVIGLAQIRTPYLPLLTSRGDEMLGSDRARNLADMDTALSFLPISAPLLPHKSVVVDYMPYLRFLVSLDDEREATFYQTHLDKKSVVGTRRSARLNGPSFRRALDIDPLHLDLIRRSVLL